MSIEATEGSRRLDPGALSLLVAGAMCVVPFLQPRHDTPIRAFYDEWLALAFGIAALGLISVLGAKSLSRVPIIGVCLALFGLSLLGRASVAGSAYSQSAVIWSLYAGFAALVVLLGHELATQLGKEKVCDVLAACLLAGSIANGAAAMLQVVGIPPQLDSFIAHLHGTRAIGNIGQANLYANYLALGEASLIYLFARDKIGMLWSLLGGIFLVSCAALAASRSSVLYALAFATLAFIASGVSKTRQIRRVLRGVIIIAASVIIAQWLVPVMMNALGFRIESGFQREATMDADPLSDHAMKVRLLVWAIAARLFLGSPWVGVGPDEFAGAAFASGLPRELSGDLVWTSPHNVIMQLLAETGLLGAMLICAGLLAWVRQSGPDLLKNGSPASWWVFACVGVEMIHALLEYPLSYAHFLAVTALVIGVGSKSAFLAPTMVMRAAVGSITAAGAILLSFHLADYFKFDLASPVSAGRSLAPESELARDKKVLTALSNTLLAPRSERWLFLAFTLDDTDLAEKVAVGERVIRLWPSREVVVRQSIFLALAGRKTEAITLLEQGLRTFSSRIALIARSIDLAPQSAREVLQPTLERHLRLGPKESDAAIGEIGFRGVPCIARLGYTPLL